MILDFKKTVEAFPPESKENWRNNNRQAFLSSQLSIIVLDDDPTGTQTMFDVPVLTTWGLKEVQLELERKTSLFFILTNSRSLTADKANKLAIEVGKNIQSASKNTGRKVLVISRSDSTLRGHYPNEVDALASGLGYNKALHIIIPAFFQGGRYTINDIHYLHVGNRLIPASETPFAKDSTFGYQSSDLKEYVEEKSGDKIRKDEVLTISLEDIRNGGPNRISAKLNMLNKMRVCIVNGFSQKDLDVFTAGFYKWQSGKEVIFRTAASILPSLVGVEVKPPLQSQMLNISGKGGVIAVGSYVPNTTEQLDFLKQHLRVEYVEIVAGNLIQTKLFKAEVDRVSERINHNLEQGKVVVVFTSRAVIKGHTPEDSLNIVNQISKGMVEVMKAIVVRPAFVIAKGGITSSDIATKAFQVKKAQVLGQIIPGVPAWKLDTNSKFPGLIYMPFPGNLGGKDAVYQAVKKLI